MCSISTQSCCGNTFTSLISECCFFQSELRVGSSRDRRVRANETAVRGLILINSSMISLSSSSISKIRCGMVMDWRRCATECSGSLTILLRRDRGNNTPLDVGQVSEIGAYVGANSVTNCRLEPHNHRIACTIRECCGQRGGESLEHIITPSVPWEAFWE